MENPRRPTLVETLRRGAVPLTGEESDRDAVLDLVGDADVVLLGEATHGTHEFQRERARITQRLIDERGFAAVALAADWADVARADRWARGAGGDASAAEALGGLRRFPHWTWRNTVVAGFLAWLRSHNDARRGREPAIPLVGLDLHGLRASMEAALEVLAGVDPAAARRARARCADFDGFGEDGRVYGLVAGVGIGHASEQALLERIVETTRRAVELAGDAFAAEEAARAASGAEAYQRAMFLDRVSSWSLREDHLFDTLDAVAARLERGGRRAKLVVWAHNAHVGDARATDPGWRGERSLGQLARERWGAGAVLIGFTTHRGSVTAAAEWGAVCTRRGVRPALGGSFEEAFHACGVPRLLLDLRRDPELADALRATRLERAIGVVYRPETERDSHYFRARIAEQFDAVIHFDETRAVEPLERSAEWERGEPASTYPFGA